MLSSFACAWTLQAAQAFQRGNSNVDARFDLSDAVHTLGFLFLGTPPPPPPFQGCGADPTADDLDCAEFPLCPPAIPGIELTSPLNGEVDVAVTRETVIRFTEPVTAMSVTPEAFSTSFGGQVLDARLHHSLARRTVTLFYLARLPASARVRVTVDGDRILDDSDVPVVADGDPGGVLTIDFDTLTLTALPGTAVTSRVLASQLAQMPGGEAMNEPLAGVTITVDGITGKRARMPCSPQGHKPHPSPHPSPAGVGSARRGFGGTFAGGAGCPNAGAARRRSVDAKRRPLIRETQYAPTDCGEDPNLIAACVGQAPPKPCTAYSKPLIGKDMGRACWVLLGPLDQRARRTPQRNLRTPPGFFASPLCRNGS